MSPMRCARAVCPAPAALRRSLLRWYRREGRDLPWRRVADNPYAQLVAETMLQQTRVQTVIPYYRRFLRRFPNVRKLARASSDDVLSLWAGLGYYSRASNLHRAAQRMVECFDGRVPETVEALRSLPGVGRYTAGAVGSIAFGLRTPILDGNVARVLARLFALTDDISTTPVRRRLWQLAEDILPRTRCGEFNQALMDLGAMVCTPRAPACPRCPLRGSCLANARGLADELPRVKSVPPVTKLNLTSLVVVAGRSVLLRQRPLGGLWGGLWEPPATERLVARRSALPIREILPEVVSARIASFHKLGSVTHTLTHRKVLFLAYGAELTGVRPRIPPGAALPRFRWACLDRLEGMAISRAHHKVLALHPSNAHSPRSHRD